MKRFVLAVLVAFCMPVYGDDSDIEKEILMSDVESVATELRSNYENILNKMRVIDPEYVELLEDSVEEDEVKLIRMRSYLAQLSYEHYKNKFLSDLKQAATETGRELKHENYTGGDSTNKYENYWLSRGRLDEKECLKDGWLICHWPDGFVEYDVAIEENFVGSVADKVDGNIPWEYRKVKFSKDVPEDNKRISCDVSLTNQAYHSNDNTTENLYIEVVCLTYEYDEFYEWRNQEVEDTLVGKYDVVGVKKLPKRSPFGKKIYDLRMNENPEIWESNTLPSVYVEGETYHFDKSTYTTGN